MLYCWKQRRAAACGEGGHDDAGHCGGGHHGGGWHHHRVYDTPPRWEASGDHDGGGFGVRRPLRFLAYKLDLDENQVAELAKVIAHLKTERAQAAVDERRALSGLADALAGETFDEGKANEAGTVRVKSADRLREAITKALARMHAVLSPEQRQKLAYLIRTGVVSI
jgi:Spy/CpxP family protein refolding chaperone